MDAVFPRHSFFNMSTMEERVASVMELTESRTFYGPWRPSALQPPHQATMRQDKMLTPYIPRNLTLFDRKVASGLPDVVYDRMYACSDCGSHVENDICNRYHGFICEKSLFIQAAILDDDVTGTPSLVSLIDGTHLETGVFPGVGQQERRLLFHIDGGKISRLSEAKIFEVWLKAAGNELNRGKETQRILDRMGDSETYMNVKFTKTDARSPSPEPLGAPGPDRWRVTVSTTLGFPVAPFPSLFSPSHPSPFAPPGLPTSLCPQLCRSSPLRLLFLSIHASVPFPDPLSPCSFLSLLNFLQHPSRTFLLPSSPVSIPLSFALSHTSPCPPHVSVSLTPFSLPILSLSSPAQRHYRCPPPSVHRSPFLPHCVSPLCPLSLTLFLAVSSPLFPSLAPLSPRPSSILYRSHSLPHLPVRLSPPDDLTSTYSELNFRKEEPRIDEDEDPPIPSGPGGLPTTAQTGPHKQESNENIGNRPYRKICLLCLVTSILVAIVAGLSIHVSQTRQSLITCDGNYRRLWDQHHEMNRTQHQYQQQVRELNSTLQSRTSENSRLDLSQRNCLKNLSVLSNKLSNLENNLTVLNSELSELNQTHTDLRHECNQLETKYRTISENKAQICQYLNRRRGETTSPRNPAPHHWGGG
ncbi:uncharacterized protein [Mobula birostris]|uniref:uncharacterized protein n=1 Tax=Mobula birostris TaxID=1983395 RepID=UPI003B28378F